MVNTFEGIRAIIDLDQRNAFRANRRSFSWCCPEQLTVDTGGVRVSVALQLQAIVCEFISRRARDWL
jgi:hypothetical protein